MSTASDAHDEHGDSNRGQNTPAPRHKRRRSRVWRIVKWALLILLLLVLIVLGLVAWVATTRSGLDFAWHQIGPRLPQGIQVASVEGRLIGPLEVRGVKVDTDAMHVAVAGVDLDWDAGALFSASVHVNNLAVRGVDYVVKKTAEEKPEPEPSNEPFSLPDAIDLPVTVQIDKVAVDDVSAVTAPDAEPLVVNSARLIDARLDGEQWRIKSLTGSGPMFDLELQATLTPRGAYATGLGVDATLRLPDLAPVEASAKIDGDLDDLALQAQVAPPYNVDLDGHVKHALDTPAVDARVTLSDTRLQAIRKDLPKAGVSTTVTAKGAIDDLAVDAEVHADSADYGKANITARAHYTPEAVTIRELHLASPDTPGTLSAKGQVALAEGNAMDMSVNWSDLQWPLSGSPAYRSKNGRVKLDGELTDYKLDTQLAWQVVGQTAGQLAVNGSGSMQAFDLASLDVTGGPGHISGQGHVAWAPALDAVLHVQGRDINPGAVVADVPGDFDLDADVRAKQTDDVLTAHVDKLTANGRLRGQPLHLDAKATYAGDHVQVDTFDLTSGATDATIAGRFGWAPDAKLDGRWTIDSSDLSTLWPTLAGRLQSEGTVRGHVKAPTVQASLDANGVAFQDNRVERVALAADVDWSGASQSDVTLDVANVEAGGQTIKSVALKLDGTPATHNLSLNLDSDLAQADVGLDGHLNKKTYAWAFSLNRLRAAYQKLAPWTLAAPASGELSANAQSIENACLTSGEARLCLRGSHDAKASAAHVELSDLAYSYAKTFFPEGLAVDGALSGAVDARLPASGSPDVDARLTTSGGAVRMARPDGKVVQVVDMQPGHIDLRMNNTAVDADVALPLAETGGIKARVSVAPGSTPLTERGLDGTVSVNIASLSVLEQLSPEVDKFDGHIAGDLNIDGTVAQPDLRGNVALTADRIVLVSPGLDLTGVRLAAEGKGHTIDIDAAAESGGGTLKAHGAVALTDSGQNVELAITGKRFQVVNIPDVTAYVSPDLKVAVTPDRVDVTGQVTIPEASITPRNLPESGVQTVSGDQVIVTDESKDEEAPAVARAIHADVKVVLGDKVHIEGFGLKADLKGDLRVVQQPAQPPTGTGEINLLDGEYRAYNQSLDIQKGRILFAGGPVSEPGIDVKAARYPTEDITVGVQVRGSVRDPKLTLFSDPNMSQSQTLSWLLLGRPLEGATGKQSSLVAKAALALGSSRGNEVLKNVGDKLGVDDIGIGSGAGESSDEAALTVGKYLSPKLYVSYGIGLFNPVSTLSMRYTLSSHWRLETTSSGAATGGDLIYSIDRN